LQSKQPVIFEYDNYRLYLRDLYAYLKGSTSHFSYRYFSRKAGFRSPNFLKLVIEGKRNLSQESIERFAQALKLKKEEAEFFRALVHLNQAETIDERKHCAEQLMRFRPFRRIHPIRRDQFDYYSKWYHIAIRELTSIPEFSEDPAWIAAALMPPVSPGQARKALELLLGLGLVERDESGRLRQTDSLITTGDEVISASVADYHREMIKKGGEAIERFPASKRDISSVTVALSEKTFKEMKQSIQRFRKELLTMADKDKDPEAVYQINFQLFPLSKEFKKRHEE